jgi:hypothetical protein
MKPPTLPSTLAKPNPEQMVRDLLDWVENEDNDMRETRRAPNVNDWHKLHNRVTRLDAVMSQFTEIRRRQLWQAIGLLLLGASFVFVGIFGDLPWVLVTAALAILLAAAVWILRE